MTQHPLRRAAVHELHARPFPGLTAPASVAYLALASERDGPMDREASRAQLIAFLDHHCAAHPAPGASHFSTDLGPARLKWEQHSEFCTYLLFADSISDPPLGGDLFARFPAEWLESGAPVISSLLLRIEPRDAPDAALMERASAWFVPESLTVASVSDGAALIAGDFRMDANDHIRFAIFAAPETAPQRLGRIVQRVLELETYKTMAMLSLPKAQAVGRQITALDARLSPVISDIAGGDAAKDAESLTELLAISAELEHLAAESRFRFGAAEAYGAIVDQRLAALRETRVGQRPLFSEFMSRRFAPAMRTCESVRARLDDLADRAGRAANLLRTRVGVHTERQNQALLDSMDRRADLQLQLQETVEGLSVVAISYYGVGLMGYLGAPLAKGIGIEKTTFMALIALPVVLSVWLMTRRIKKRIIARSGQEHP